MEPLCTVCHQPLLPTYYFCPNCGREVNEPPLPITLSSQATLYIFSAILPWICFIGITKWKGFKYLRSKDSSAKTIGLISTAILLVSLAVAAWFLYWWTQNAIQKSLNSINTDFGI
jgi:hypothetical protein